METTFSYKDAHISLALWDQIGHWICQSKQLNSLVRWPTVVLLLRTLRVIMAMANLSCILLHFQLISSKLFSQLTGPWFTAGDILQWWQKMASESTLESLHSVTRKIAVFSEVLISCKTALICLNTNGNDIINGMVTYGIIFVNQSECSILAPVNKSENSHCETFPTLSIGVSLSEPHTSVTSLCTCMCMFACLDRPLTENLDFTCTCTIQI